VKREQLTYESEGESSQVIRFDVEKAESKSTQEHDRDVAYEHHSRWLTPREKEIFSLIFVENQTQTDVARKLGISEARVSHIMQNQILEKVRLSIATEIIDD
jgi:DNA-directed RNA polymerase specialized sigma subunit